MIANENAQSPEPPKRKRKSPAARRPQPLAVAQVPDALLTMTTAATLVGVSEPTLYRKAKSDPTFPRLVKMGQRCTRIRAGDLMAWLAAQAAQAAQ